MKLGKFIVMFVGCVAFFAILFPPLVEVRLQAAISVHPQKSYIQDPGVPRVGFDEPMFPSFGEDDPFPPLASSPQRDVQKETSITRGYNAIGYNAMNADEDWTDVLEFIECEIKNSCKSNPYTIIELLSNVVGTIRNGLPFVRSSYVTEENIAFLEECVNSAEDLYGYREQCEKIKDKLAEIKGIFF